MKKLIMSAAVFLGCGPESTSIIKDIDTQRYYRCTDAQWVTVEKESLFCRYTIEAYSSAHCFDSAIVRNCDAKAVKQ